jgi:hypothetical protein
MGCGFTQNSFSTVHLLFTMENTPDPYQKIGNDISLFNDAQGSVFRTHQILLNVHHFKRNQAMTQYAEELERWFTEVCSKMDDKELLIAKVMLKDVINKASEFQRISNSKLADHGVRGKHLNETNNAGFELEIFLRKVMDRHGLGMPNKEVEGFFNDE